MGASDGAPLRLDRLYRARRGTANLQVDGRQRLCSLGGLRRRLPDIAGLVARYACSPAGLHFQRKKRARDDGAGRTKRDRRTGETEQ